MTNRWADWFAQAERDMEQAAESRSSGRHEWACFAAHQAAEKALKALHMRHGQESWGHVVARLLDDLPADLVASSDMVEKARVLDGYYIPTRYPNGHPAGAPFEHFGSLQSGQALEYGGEIIEFARAALA